MAFQTIAPNIDLADMADLQKRADPFAVLGNAMTQLDGLIDQRHSKQYLSTLDEATMASPQLIFNAMNKAPNDIAKKSLATSFENVNALQTAQAQQAKMAYDLAQAEQMNVNNAQDRIIKVDEHLMKKEDQGLKTQDRRIKIEQDKTERTAVAKNTIADIDNSVALLDKMLDPKNQAGMEGMTGPIDSMVGAWDNESRVFESDLRSLKAKLFLDGAGKMKGLGSLTGAEGEKIAVAIADLDTAQSYEEFNSKLTLIRNQLKASREVEAEKYKDVLNPPKTDGEKPSIDSFFGDK